MTIAPVRRPAVTNGPGPGDAPLDPALNPDVPEPEDPNAEPDSASDPDDSDPPAEPA